MKLPNGQERCAASYAGGQHAGGPDGQCHHPGKVKFLGAWYCNKHIGAAYRYAVHEADCLAHRIVHQLIAGKPWPRGADLGRYMRLQDALGNWLPVHMRLPKNADAAGKESG